MATTEELDVVIRTVADTRGAQQVSQSLQQAQQSAGGLQQQLTAQQQFANQVLRQSMAQVPQTLDAFRLQAHAVEAQVGARPTLQPEDLGIRAIQQVQQAHAATANAAAATVRNQAAAVAGAAQTTTAATRALTQATAEEEVNMLRLGGAFVGVGVGLSVFTTAGRLAHDAIASIIGDTLEFQRALQANDVALGTQSQSFQQFAATVSQQAGVAQAALLQAGTAAQQFARTVGFGPEQTQGVVALGVALARLQGTDPSQSINLLTQALQGNAQAAQSLNLQLDASFIAFSQLGGASAEVFNQLDPATQAALRYAAAVDQIGQQSDKGVSPQQELAKAMGDLGKDWEAFVNTVGPGVVGALAKIAGGADAAIGALQRLNAITVERNRQSGASDEDFKNERAALDALGQAVQDRFGPVAQAVTDKVQEVGGAVSGAVQQANDAVRETTGVDVLQAVADAAQSAGEAVGEWADRVGDGFDQLGQSASAAADAITGSFRDADAALQQTAQTAEQARQAQLAVLAGSVAAPTAVLQAAQQNEITAARELVRLKQDSLELGAQEAAIRLQMLPAQERMLELQLQANRAQIEATQRSLPAQRGLQDLQNQLEEQRLIAQSGFRPMEERQAALRTGAGLVQQLPEAQLAATRAQAGVTPSQRAAQDVQLQQQLLALDQQQATAGLEFQRQQISLLGTIADAAKQAAQRTIEIAIQAINVAVQTAGGITEDDEKRITELAGSEVMRAIHQAVQTVNQRSAPQQLLGAGG